MMEYPWTREIEDIAREFNVDIHTGLTEAQVRLSLQKYGKNGKGPSLPKVPLFSSSDGSRSRSLPLNCFTNLWRCSVTRRPADAVMEISPWTIQGSVGGDITWVGGNFICPCNH